jgi:hypothetical protein
MQNIFYVISCIIIYFLCIKPIVKLFIYYSLLIEGINEDICDIKKHLGLPVQIRTHARRHSCILNKIKYAIIANKSKEEILEDINSEDFGDSEILGKVNLKSYEQFIENMQKEAKNAPHTFKSSYE